MPQRPSHMPPTSRATRASRAMPLLATLTVAIAGCGPTPPGRSAAYQPRTREITVTTVPLLVKEAQAVYPFLKSDFAKGGMLEGKEVYAFSPSTIIVVEGDTIHFTLVNPEDDLHSFVLPDLAVALPGQRVTNATYVARRSGIYPIVCSVPSHLPMMWGQLLVLPAAAMGATVPGATTGEAGGKR